VIPTLLLNGIRVRQRKKQDKMQLFDKPVEA
jgi:hypothetical protein